MDTASGVELGTVEGVVYSTRSVYAAGLRVSNVVDPTTYLKDL